MSVAEFYAPGVLWDVCEALEGHLSATMPGVPVELGALGPRLDLDENPVIGIGIEEEVVDDLEAGGDTETCAAVLRIGGWAAFLDGEQNLRTILGVGRGIRHGVRRLFTDDTVMGHVDIVALRGVRYAVSEWDDDSLLYGATLRLAVTFTEEFTEG